MPAYLNKLLHLGGRLSVYDALIRSIKGEEERPDEWRLEDSLIVAGLHYRSKELLPIYWPRDNEPIFTADNEYLPTLLSITHSSPFPRVRSLAATASPNFESGEFQSGVNSDVPLELEPKIIFSAKCGCFEEFASHVNLLATKCDTEGRWYRVSGLQGVAVDYCVGRGGSFLRFPCGGKGENYQVIDGRQLFELLRIPFHLQPEDQSEMFKSIVQVVRPIHDLGDYIWQRTSNE
jgi:hypothetical protein